MTQTSRYPETRALRRAARRFTHALTAEDLLGDTARIEAVVHAAEAEPVFLFEAALRAAWPRASDGAPRREVVWAADNAPDDAFLQVRAFDGGGRLLLCRTYGLRLGAEAVS
ncbi:MAG: hypothetical protein E7812_02435 [Phenylobacterium sp.]|nr:MAG: hypothetical protein E7812_02435 [Phenylobacterium sp.]